MRDSHHALREGKSAAFSVGSLDNSRLVVLASCSAGNGGACRMRTSRRGPISRASPGLGVDLQQMIFLPEGTLPHTSSGKIRRIASREAYIGNALSNAIRA